MSKVTIIELKPENSFYDWKFPGLTMMEKAYTRLRAYDKMDLKKIYSPNFEMSVKI